MIPSHRRVARSSIALACAFSLVAASVATLAHHAREAHAVCVEHGESIHLERGSSSAMAPAPSDAVSRSDSNADHGEHCAATHIVPRVASAPAAVATAGALRFSDPTPPRPPRVRVAALYSLAPKTSPPTALSLPS